MAEDNTGLERAKKFARDYGLPIGISAAGFAVAAAGLKYGLELQPPAFVYSLDNAAGAISHSLGSVNFAFCSCDCGSEYAKATEALHSGIGVASGYIQSAIDQGCQNAAPVMEKLSHASNDTCLLSAQSELVSARADIQSIIISEMEELVIPELASLFGFIGGGITGLCGLGWAHEKYRKNRKAASKRNR